MLDLLLIATVIYYALKTLYLIKYTQILTLKALSKIKTLSWRPLSNFGTILVKNFEKLVQDNLFDYVPNTSMNNNGKTTFKRSSEFLLWWDQVSL